MNHKEIDRKIYEHLELCGQREFDFWMRNKRINNQFKKTRLYREAFKLPDLYDRTRKEKYCVINKGDYSYGYFNMCFLNNMVSNIVWVLMHGFMPIIDMATWNTFFLQPLEIKEGGSKSKSFSNVKCPLHGEIQPGFETVYRKADLKFWVWIYKEFVKFNDRTSQYIEEEYNTLLKGKKVLGVLCRGTDYVSTKPQWHPIQPDVDMVIVTARKKLKKYKLDYIYLATEEKRIAEKFEREFPGKIITNKRVYYDEKYYGEKKKLIWEVQIERDNDNYYRGLEYLSSLVLLSRCSVLIGGNCGGTLGALLFNGLHYKDYEIFDLGLYGVDDI